ncbi:unnamed protein product [Blepharisma stoltei]|uniref:Uncharacterized protein n=1 Tax=Blepharisma stoltei TaxID=1481888 RepID=A0AAU9J2X3_9CILI|nr:unnamed protein product [Blepharisma stoltei]
MLWLRLKLQLIPCIAEEVSRACELYQMLLQEAGTGDKSKLKELTLLQASIRGRIQEFEDFFEENAEHPFIQFFEKQKLRLRKLLQMEIPKPKPVEKPYEPEIIIEKAPDKPKSISTDDFVKDLLQKPSKRLESASQSQFNLQGDWKELVFKIKLTREEYNKLMIMKSKRPVRF